MNTKTCIGCNEQFSLCDFPAYKNKGKQYYRSRCKKCHCKQSCEYNKTDTKKQYYKEYYQKNKDKAYEYNKVKWDKRYELFYNEVYVGKSCERCGFNDIRALELHHKDPNNKDFTIGSVIRTKKWEDLMNEVAKCEILCANCHKIEHSGRYRNQAYSSSRI